MPELLHRLGYRRRGHHMAVTRDDLVGQYVGHTAPKTKDVLKKAMGEVLFVDEAYYLYRAENERDYGQEAIEILLQVMEKVFADYVRRRKVQPRFANARSIRNAIERARLRHANRILESSGPTTRDQLMRLEPEDFLGSRVFEEPTDTG